MPHAADIALIDRFLEMMAAEAGASRNTLLAYQGDLIAASEVLGGRLGTAQAHELNRLSSAWGDLANSTLARKSASLRRFFGFLADEGMRGDDPSSALARPTTRRALPKVLSRDDVDLLFEEIEFSRNERWCLWWCLWWWWGWWWWWCWFSSAGSAARAALRQHQLPLRASRST